MAFALLCGSAGINLWSGSPCLSISYGIPTAYPSTNAYLGKGCAIATGQKTTLGERQAGPKACGIRALIATGCVVRPPSKPPPVGSRRSTTWAVLNHAKRAGPTAAIIKRILSLPDLPPRARRKFEEYVKGKIGGI